MTQSEHVNPEQLAKTPYIQVLTYPRVSLSEAKKRIKQLRALGIEEVIFEGRARIGRLGVQGIGTVGVVVRAKVGADVMALKVRRTDANRDTMDEEARLSTMANKIGVGVPFYSHTKDFALMKLIEYEEIREWLVGLKGAGRRNTARDMIHSVLNQCRKLDIVGLDHGQLSNLRKHIVVAEGRPWILDFESASTLRRARNVTAATQYLFIGGRVAPMVKKFLGLRDMAELRRLLSDYKSDESDYTYSRMLEVLKLV